LKSRSRRREEEERGVTENGQNAKIYREKERNTYQIVKMRKLKRSRRREEERRAGAGGERRRGKEKNRNRRREEGSY